MNLAMKALRLGKRRKDPGSLEEVGRYAARAKEMFENLVWIESQEKTDPQAAPAQGSQARQLPSSPSRSSLTSNFCG